MIPMCAAEAVSGRYQDVLVFHTWPQLCQFQDSCLAACVQLDMRMRGSSVCRAGGLLRLSLSYEGREEDTRDRAEDYLRCSDIHLDRSHSAALWVLCHRWHAAPMTLCMQGTLLSLFSVLGDIMVHSRSAEGCMKGCGCNEGPV